jgi:hypothetical protein
MMTDMGKKITQRVTVQKGRDAGGSGKSETYARASKVKNPQSRLYDTDRGISADEYTNVERKDAKNVQAKVGPGGVTVYTGEKKDRKSPSYRKPKK